MKKWLEFFEPIVYRSDAKPGFVRVMEQIEKITDESEKTLISVEIAQSRILCILMLQNTLNDESRIFPPSLLSRSRGREGRDPGNVLGKVVEC